MTDMMYASLFHENMSTHSSTDLKMKYAKKGHVLLFLTSPLAPLKPGKLKGNTFWFGYEEIVK